MTQPPLPRNRLLMLKPLPTTSEAISSGLIRFLACLAPIVVAILIPALREVMKGLDLGTIHLPATYIWALPVVVAGIGGLVEFLVKWRDSQSAYVIPPEHARTLPVYRASTMRHYQDTPPAA